MGAGRGKGESSVAVCPSLSHDFVQVSHVDVADVSHVTAAGLQVPSLSQDFVQVSHVDVADDSHVTAAGLQVPSLSQNFVPVSHIVVVADDSHVAAAGLQVPSLSHDFVQESHVDVADDSHVTVVGLREVECVADEHVVAVSAVSSFVGDLSEQETVGARSLCESGGQGTEIFASKNPSQSFAENSRIENGNVLSGSFVNQSANQFEMPMDFASGEQMSDLEKVRKEILFSAWDEVDNAGNVSFVSAPPPNSLSNEVTSHTSVLVQHLYFECVSLVCHTLKYFVSSPLVVLTYSERYNLEYPRRSIAFDLRVVSPHALHVSFLSASFPNYPIGGCIGDLVCSVAS